MALLGGDRIDARIIPCALYSHSTLGTADFIPGCFLNGFLASQVASVMDSIRKCEEQERTIKRLEGQLQEKMRSEPEIVALRMNVDTLEK